MKFDLQVLADKAGATGDTQAAVLIEIIGRLDALIEAVKSTQKARMVTLECLRNSLVVEWTVNPDNVSDVYMLGLPEDNVSAVVLKNYGDNEYMRVKGTVAEVTAKLRGEG